MNWPGNHSAENSQKPVLLPNPTPLQASSWWMILWPELGRGCYVDLCRITMCVTLTRLGHSQRPKSLGGDMSQKYSLFCSTNFKILGSLYTILVYVPSPALKSCDRWYLHPVLKHRTEAFNLICCSSDWKNSILQNSLFRNKLCMYHCSLQ